MADAIAIDELKRLLAAGETPTLLDVRRKDDHEAAPQHIAAARWCDPQDVERWADELPGDREVIVYCVKGGAVSQSTADRLAEKGFEVRYLQGGILAWNAAGDET